MADITIYKPVGLEVVVIDGQPPVDQSALVAQLQNDLAAMTVARDAAAAERDALAAKIAAAIAAAQAEKAADEATTAGQAVLDALA